MITRKYFWINSKLHVVICFHKNFETMLSDADIIARRDICIVSWSAIHPQLRIIWSFRFRIKIETYLCIESEHISRHLQIVSVSNIVNRLVFSIRNNSLLVIITDKIRINQTYISMKQSLGTFAALSHRMVKSILYKWFNILLCFWCRRTPL